MTTPSLDAPVLVSDVSHQFQAASGQVPALDGVSFDVASGEFLSIVGPSGCGKSTLVTLISGLLTPTRGTITVAGEVVRRPQTQIGIVFQSPVLLAWRSALDNVLLQIEMRGMPTAPYRERARELLAAVGLRNFERHLPHQLSGGMRQRVSICRALIHDPPLLLMDEPFGALDAITRDQLTLDLQRLWSQKRKTVIFITHSITEAVFLSDRIIVMTPGPGRVDRVIEIALPRPRRLTLREDKRFLDYARLVRDRFLAYGILREAEANEEGAP
jgi:NitT/TauT family transport system ATP-binding protein